MVNTISEKSQLLKKKPASLSSPKPNAFKSTGEWGDYVIANWDSLRKQSTDAKVDTPYNELVVIAFSPVIPSSASSLRTLLKLIESLRYTDALVNRLKNIYKDMNFTRTAVDLAKHDLAESVLKPDERLGLDWLLVATCTLHGFMNKKQQNKSFLSKLLSDPKDVEPYPSAVRVQAGMISAGQNVVFAGQDVNIVSDHYQGSKVQLKSYLGALRTDWNMPTTTIHPSSPHQAVANLHTLYTPVDVWKDDADFKQADGIKQLNQRRFLSIDRDLNEDRQPVLEAIARNPLIVITGGAGTGKSSLCRFIVTALAYACDPSAEKRDNVNGLELLGAAWIHGPMIPLYVSLRDFFNAEDIFSKANTKHSAESLLKYIKKSLGSFGQYLEKYITKTDVQTQGALLVLDGLDEVYEKSDRIVLRGIIESWADRFPFCRVIITSRTYAYRHNVRWRLSDRFVSAELAPFTWRQMDTYIDRWYQHAADTRPGAFGGRTVANDRAVAMSEDLKQTIHNNKTVIPLARHPLMLALLTLIHEDYRHLPSKRAELYRQTVELLDRWNIPLPTDQLHEKLATINLEQMRAALKLVAFQLQSQQTHYERYPTTIKRGQLLEELKQQQEIGNGLGANIEDVLEYLATRNGILVSDTPKLYRFPHLSVQEYLTACALIEFYDECPMPDALKRPANKIWTFPQNVVALLRHDYARWRNVTLFAGSILAADTGQDRRWQLIDELLPPKVDPTVSDNILHSICVAAEIWAESYLKPRTHAQHAVEEHLKKWLEAIINDERIDPPDNATNLGVLGDINKK